MFYSDLHKLHEELKGIRKSFFFFVFIYKLYLLDLLHHENIWLDTLQNKIYTTATSGADAEETSEELDVNFF